MKVVSRWDGAQGHSSFPSERLRAWPRRWACPMERRQEALEVHCSHARQVTAGHPRQSSSHQEGNAMKRMKTRRQFVQDVAGGLAGGLLTRVLPVGVGGLLCTRRPMAATVLDPDNHGT